MRIALSMTHRRLTRDSHQDHDDREAPQSLLWVPEILAGLFRKFWPVCQRDRCLNWKSQAAGGDGYGTTGRRARAACRVREYGRRLLRRDRDREGPSPKWLA